MKEGRVKFDPSVGLDYDSVELPVAFHAPNQHVVGWLYQGDFSASPPDDEERGR